MTLSNLKRYELAIQMYDIAIQAQISNSLQK